MFIPLHFVANRRGVAKPAGIIEPPRIDHGGGKRRPAAVALPVFMGFTLWVQRKKLEIPLANQLDARKARPKSRASVAPAPALEGGGNLKCYDVKGTEKAC
jgi:hypothetical protein